MNCNLSGNVESVQATYRLAFLELKGLTIWVSSTCLVVGIIVLEMLYA